LGHLDGHADCDAVQPTPEGDRVPYPSPVLDQGEERRLECVFGICLPQQVPTNAPDHRPVPPNDPGEGGVVPVRSKRLIQATSDTDPARSWSRTPSRVGRLNRWTGFASRASLPLIVLSERTRDCCAAASIFRIVDPVQGILENEIGRGVGE